MALCIFHLRRIAVTALFTVVLSACFPLAPLREETFELEPTRVASIFGDKQVQQFGVCAGLDSRGTRLYLWDEFVRQNEVLIGAPRPISMAGYEIGVHRGQSCHLRILDTFQAAVAFDLTTLPTTAVTNAELRIRQRFSPLDPARPRGTTEQCQLVTVHQAAEDWRAGLFSPDSPSGPRSFIASVPIRPASDRLSTGLFAWSAVDVTTTVGWWVRGERQNQGFTIMPSVDEAATLLASTDREPGWMCDFGIVEIKLVVSVAVPAS